MTDGYVKKATTVVVKVSTRLLVRGPCEEEC